jgi:cobalt-zinc-cadmium efflux system outer membrane protein
MALKHNHSLLATRATVQQNLSQEISANLRPNPTLFGDWEYLPLAHSNGGYFSYLRDSTEADIGLNYLFERGSKRQHRLEAAKDNTAVTRATVTDTERGLTFQVATLFINAQLAESTLELAELDLKSFQTTVDIGERQFTSGGIAENDYLKIKLQLLQFQQDVEQAKLAKMQSLSDLRQQLGYESVPANYDVSGPFEYHPLPFSLEDMQRKALATRPDLRAAQLSLTAANSQYTLAQANSKQDVTAGANYSHTGGLSTVTFSVSVPLPIFDRNQGEIARTSYVIAQAREQLAAANGQVMTDVRDAWEGLQTNDQVARFYVSGYLDVAQKSRDISEYAYRRGATALLDFLDAERTYRATQLAWRQTIAAWLLSLEQMKQAVGTRTLP